MRKKFNKTKYLKALVIELALSILVFIGMLFYAQRFDFRGVMDASFISGFIMFLIGWLLYITDFGIFDVTVYGIKQFGLALVGKQPKKTLDETLYNKERLDSFVYLSMWTTGLIVMIIGLLLYYYYYRFL